MLRHLLVLVMMELSLVTTDQKLWVNLKALDSATDGMASAKTIAAAADAGAKPNR